MPNQGPILGDLGIYVGYVGGQSKGSPPEESVVYDGPTAVVMQAS